MNELKWIVFRRCGYDKEQSIKYWKIIYTRCKAHQWGEEWTQEQKDEFMKYTEMLLPHKVDLVLELIEEVFGKFEVINNGNREI